MGVYTSKHKEDKTAQVLLLGIGGSGKSTLLKQLQLKYGNGFSVEEKAAYYRAINKNAFTSLQYALYHLTTTESNSIELSLSINRVFIQRIIRANPNKYSFNELPFKVEINSLLDDPGFNNVARTIYDEYHHALLCRLSLDYFDITEEDILRCHLPTKHPNRLYFSTPSELKFSVTDIGGSLKERMEWNRYYSSSHVVVWLVDLHEYNTPRLAEALRIFENTINTEELIDKPILLIFSKYDLLFERFPDATQHVSFPDYAGPQTIDNFAYFVFMKFSNADKHVGDPRLHYTISALNNHHYISTLVEIIKNHHPNPHQILRTNSKGDFSIVRERIKSVKQEISVGKEGSEELDKGEQEDVEVEEEQEGDEEEQEEKQAEQELVAEEPSPKKLRMEESGDDKSSELSEEFMELMLRFRESGSSSSGSNSEGSGGSRGESGENGGESSESGNWVVIDADRPAKSERTTEETKDDEVIEEIAKEEARDEEPKHEESKREEPKHEAAKDEAAKEEAAKEEAAKDEAAKDEAANDEAANDEAAKDEVAKDEAAKDEAAKNEAAKNEAAKNEAAKDEAAKEQAKEEEVKETQHEKEEVNEDPKESGDERKEQSDQILAPQGVEASIAVDEQPEPESETKMDETHTHEKEKEEKEEVTEGESTPEASPRGIESESNEEGTTSQTEGRKKENKNDGKETSKGARKKKPKRKNKGKQK